MLSMIVIRNLQQTKRLYNKSTRHRGECRVSNFNIGHQNDHVNYMASE